MKNRSAVYRLLSLLLIAAMAVLIVSCNLPQKVTPEMQISGQSGSGGDDENPEDEDDGWSDQVPVLQPWTEPEPGPTVTPIVLMIEKRGEEGSMIIRDDYDSSDGEDETVYYDDEDTVYYDDYVPGASASQSTAVPASAGEMRDEMKLIYFNPYNNSVVLPGQALHLDIVLKNTGTTTWQTSYKVIDYSDMPMAAQKEFYLPYPVAPNGTVELSVYMTAPTGLGSYPENFYIEDAYGVIFGYFDYTLTVGAFSSVTDIPTQPPAPTATYYSPDGITATPDSLAWMCVDPERSKLQDCHQFCVEYSDRPEFRYCYYDGVRYLTPVP